MKHFLQISFLFFIFSSIVLSQIPNAGFENWTLGEPDGWVSSNVPSIVTNVTQTTESYTGSSAVKLVIGSFFTIPYWGHIYSSTQDVTDAGFPVSQRYGSLKGYYKLNSSATKVLEITIAFQKSGEVIGGGVIILGGDVPNYTQFTVPADYYTTDIPDTAVINIAYLDTAEQWTIGGGAFIDDLTLEGLVDVKESFNNQQPTSYKLLQNYPNPFNPTTNIEYSIPEESFVNLRVYNTIGEEVAVLVNQSQKAGSYNVEFNGYGIQSGIYIAKLTVNSFSTSIKMVLLK